MSLAATPVLNWMLHHRKPCASCASTTCICVRSARRPISNCSSCSIWTRHIGESATVVTAFQKGLNETGFTEARNVAMEYRWADGQYERLGALATDLVHQPVGLIAAVGG